jgi:hypothetical protein
MTRHVKNRLFRNIAFWYVQYVKYFRKINLWICYETYGLRPSLYLYLHVYEVSIFSSVKNVSATPFDEMKVVNQYILNTSHLWFRDHSCFYGFKNILKQLRFSIYSRMYGDKFVTNFKHICSRIEILFILKTQYSFLKWACMSVVAWSFWNSPLQNFWNLSATTLTNDNTISWT